MSKGLYDDIPPTSDGGSLFEKARAYEEEAAKLDAATPEERDVTITLPPAPVIRKTHDEIVDRYKRLLRGAITSALQAGGKLGPEVDAWWRKQPEHLDNQARAAVLSISRDEYSALKAYIEKHGSLPERTARPDPS